ncbi:Na+/H+ antiporter NhaC family protein [Flavilitoribacter nigricans]|uniref:Sodium:proton antiporter n=1 Tax=Flavilitoribacter nigricans (strain ATCC 23147 / DSM 23189 / NBRC 102662 / NCIMB 1420 / SS-2) TaxID=1122177 RepID=A0A2D0NAV6_FLAN2|nr:Na+/H+ antiporter NhaC family protein [Flavilitoribacter nigricans]PHN05652.1 sodium:proton antiporter [Flavilitoribacter nigricans DSM 23189 = NBRC 102662]
MRYYLLLLSVIFFVSSLTAQSETDSLPAQDSIPVQIAEPAAPIAEAEPTPVNDISLQADGEQVIIVAEGTNGPGRLLLNEESVDLDFSNGRAILSRETSPKGELLLFQTNDKSYSLYHVAQKNDRTLRIRHIPLWLSILPPLIAIVLALIFREVVISLFVGVWVGAFIAGGIRLESLYYFLLSFLEVVQVYIINALNDSGHLSVLIFSLLIGGMVAVISRNGGMAGVVQSLTRYARSPKSSQFITWVLGVAIFFDDYANTLIVGNTMRSVTDKFRVSREKLAYIVDSTAAPVAAVAFITTWIGAELGYIDDGISQLSGFDTSLTPYAIFISSLKYSFYPILTLLFILMLIYTQRDFGPMLKAEQRAKDTGEVRAIGLEETGEDLEDLSPVPGAPLKWHNAVIPVAVVILMTIFGLVDTGMSSSFSALADAGAAPASQSWGAVWGALGGITPMDNPGFFMKLGTLIGNADSYVALLWASLSGVTVAILMTLIGRIMKLGEAIGTLTTGFKTMLPALIILTLAWSLAATTDDLHTATYLTSSLADSLNPYLMPVIIFILSALISFSTGSSWSTMAILYPIAIPTTWAIGIAQGMEPGLAMELLLNVIAVTLAASVLGDHCSPISDTTILSSLASDCNHIDHVRTQLPYALTVGAVSLVANGISTLLGGGWLICFIILLASIAVLYLIVLRVGKVKQ